MREECRVVFFFLQKISPPSFLHFFFFFFFNLTMSLLSESLGLSLWEASTSGDASAVKKLLQTPGINVNWEDERLKRSPIYRAAGHGRVGVVKALLADHRVQVNHQQSQGGTALGVACQQGFTEVVKLLLADPHIEVQAVFCSFVP